jgi:hypothetical protein
LSPLIDLVFESAARLILKSLCQFDSQFIAYAYEARGKINKETNV